jgi:hypothetical protein
MNTSRTLAPLEMLLGIAAGICIGLLLAYTWCCDDCHLTLSAPTQHNSAVGFGGLTQLKARPREIFGGACVVSNTNFEPCQMPPTPGPRPSKELRGLCFLARLGVPLKRRITIRDTSRPREDVAQTASAPKAIARADPDTRG